MSEKDMRLSIFMLIFSHHLQIFILNKIYLIFIIVLKKLFNSLNVYEKIADKLA